MPQEDFTPPLPPVEYLGIGEFVLWVDLGHYKWGFQKDFASWTSEGEASETVAELHSLSFSAVG